MLSAAIAIVTTPAFGALARRAGIVVAPRADRWHSRPTPLLGGAAMALAVLGTLVLVLPLSGPLIALLGCAALAFVLGLLDDFRHVAPSTKLAGQVIVASALALAGIHLEAIPWAPVSFVLTVFWIVGLMNAVNLLDNMDGLAAGIVAIAAAVVGISALGGSPQVALVAAAVAGAAVGFLVHNFSPARIFMGDAGSQMLGFLIAALALLHTSRSAANLGLAVLGPLAVLALPILDTALVTASRRLAGRPIAQGGRDHTSHRLAKLGFSDREAVLVLYTVAIALAVAGLLAEEVSTLIAPVLVIATVALILFGVFLGEVDVYGGGERGSASERPFLRMLKVYGRFGAEVGMDVALLTTAYYLSFLIRFESVPQREWLYLVVDSTPLVVGLQIAALVGLGVYRTLWRYLSVHDAVTIVRATFIGTGAAALGILLLYRFEGYSRAAFVLDFVMASALIFGSRLFFAWLRQWPAARPVPGERRVLIVGADDRGALALRLLPRTEGPVHRAVGFLDDDLGKRYRRVGGVPIVGTTHDMEEVSEKLRVDLVLFADTGDGDAGRLRAACERLGIEWRELATL